MTKRQKALDKYEREKRKQSMEIEDRNLEKMEMTKRCQEERKEAIFQI